MPSTPTTRLRLEKQGSGENSNTWGDKLNEAVFDLIDESIAGVLAFSLSGAKTLTSANYEADEARNAVINVTGGTGGTITIPSVEKSYLVRNAASDDVVVTTGAGATATVKAGNIARVFSDGVDAYLAGIFDYGATVPKSSGTPSDDDDLVNKVYADNLALSANLPGQAGNSGKFLYTNGSTASWAYPILTNATGTLPTSGVPAFSGDVSNSAGSLTMTLGNNSVTLSKMAQVATARVLGRSTAGTGNVEALTATQTTALLDTFTESIKGLVPPPGTASGKYLRDNGTWGATGFPTVGSSGSYVFPDSVALSATDRAPIANFLYLFPFSTPGTYDAIVFNQIQPMVGENTKLGIYSTNADGSPGDLIVSADFANGSATGARAATIAETTIGGPVWIAFLCDGLASAERKLKAAEYYAAGADNIFANVTYGAPETNYYLSKVYTFGALPATAGTGFVLQDTPSSPLVGLRIA